MAVRDTLPIPPPKQRNESVDIALQRQLEEQREQEAAQQAQIINQQNQQQLQQSATEEPTENQNVDIMIAKAARHARSGAIVGGLGLGFMSAFVTLIGPIIGVGLLAIAAFLLFRAKTLYKRAAALAITQTSFQIKRKFIKKAYNAQTIFFSSCSGCAGIFLTGILFVGFAVVALDMITGAVGNTVTTIVDTVKTVNNAAASQTTKQTP